MSTRIRFAALALTLILIAGCAGSGGWNVIETPTDPHFLFATGNGESQNLQVAIDKATMNARTEIARQLELQLNTMQKNFVEEIGGGTDSELNQLFSETTKAVVSTQLMGSKAKDTQYREEGGKYQARVLVEYSLAAAKAALAEQIKKDKNLYTRFQASEGFKEMEKEVEQYQNSQNAH